MTGGADSSDSARRPRRPRRLLLLGGALLLAWPTYYLVANRALDSAWLKQRANRRPEKFAIEWSAAHTVFPGLVRLEGLRVRGQARHAQWYAELDELRVWFSPTALLARRAQLYRVRGRGLEFRLRRRLTPGQQPPPAAPHYPEIPGLANPPDPAPLPPPKRRPPWTVAIADLEVDDLHEVWLNGMRLGGGGRISLDMDLEVRGPIAIDHATLQMPAAELWVDSERIARDLAIDAAASMDEFVYREHRGRALFGLLSADLRVSGEIFRVGMLEEHVGQASGIEFTGGGTLDAEVHVQRGALMPGTRLDIDSPGFGVGFWDYQARGAATVRGLVEQRDGRTSSTMRVEVREIEVDRRGHEEIPLHGPGLTLRTVSDDPGFVEGFPLRELELEMADLTVSDVSLFSDTIPEVLDLELQSGSATVDAGFRLDHDRSATGFLDLDADGIRARGPDGIYGGSFDLHAAFSSDEFLGKRFDLAGTTLALQDIVLPGTKQKKQDAAWWGRLSLDHSEIDLDPPAVIDAEVGFQFKDLRPILSMLRAGDDAPGWLGMVPNVKEIDGEIDVRLEKKAMELRRMAVGGRGLDVRAVMQAGEQGTEGKLFVRYTIFSAGISFSGGQRKWRLSRPRRWFEEETGILGIGDESGESSP